MGQAASSPSSQPQAGIADRQTARRSSVWGTPTVLPSDSDINAQELSSQTRSTRRDRRASINRIAQLLPSVVSQDGLADQQPPSRPSMLQRARNSILPNRSTSSLRRAPRSISNNNLWPISRRQTRPQPANTASQIDLAGADTDDVPSSEIDAHNVTTSVTAGSDTQRPATGSRRSSTRLANSLSERLAGLRTGRTNSHTSTVRTRRSGTRQAEDNTALLSQLLSVAAAATAATLLDGDEQAISQARGTALDGDDGSFDGFLRSLESGSLAAALRQGGQPSEDNNDGTSATNTPLNLFRMFRFGTPTETAPTGTTPAATESHGTTDNITLTDASSQPSPAVTPANNTRGRMVPIIIVGIRAVTPGSNPRDEQGVPPFLDALSALPTTPLNSNTAAQDITNEVLRGPQNGSRFSHRRRSIGATSRFPLGYDNQRDLRSPDRNRPRSITSDATNWPRPPPASPASPNLSAGNSRNPTPGSTAPASRRASYSSTPRRDSIIRTTTTTTLETTTEDTPVRPRAARQRRLSDSDHRHSAYSSRRNGVVEPDTATSRPASSGENTRSWIIYVLGGSYPENHPILTTPSLFTDSPSYEDMMMLSQLLGPAKPPVASEKDVAQAGGIYRVEVTSDSDKTATLVAAAVETEDRITLTDEQRCLVCLCDFEEDDEARLLTKCNHLFHKECIDQWLTKGRNSCPLCRGQGVHETDKKAEEAPPVDSAAPTPEMPTATTIPAI